MPTRMTRHQVDRLADHLSALIEAMTAHRGGRGPHWIGVGELVAALRRHGVQVSAADCDRALMLAAGRGVVRLEGDPPHSVAPLALWTAAVKS